MHVQVYKWKQQINAVNSVIICLKSAIATLEKAFKYVQSLQKSTPERHQWRCSVVFLRNFCFCCWLWTGKYLLGNAMLNVFQNFFKINKDTKTMVILLLCCLYCNRKGSLINSFQDFVWLFSVAVYVRWKYDNWDVTRGWI